MRTLRTRMSLERVEGTLAGVHEGAPVGVFRALLTITISVWAWTLSITLCAREIVRRPPRGALMVRLMGFFFGVILTRSAIAYSRRERTHPRPCHLARGLAVCHRRSSHHPPNGNTIWPPLSPYCMALELELPPKGSDGGGFIRSIAVVVLGPLEVKNASADHFLPARTSVEPCHFGSAFWTA